MVRARGTLQSSESTGPPPLHAIFLLVQPKSEIISNDVAELVVSHHSLPKCVVLKGGFDQTTGRSAGENHLSASVPTLELFGFPCNRSVVFASSATLLLLTQILVCCIDRLNPQPKAATRKLVNANAQPLSFDSTRCSSLPAQYGFHLATLLL